MLFWDRVAPLGGTLFEDRFFKRPAAVPAGPAGTRVSRCDRGVEQCEVCKYKLPARRGAARAAPADREGARLSYGA